MFQAIVKFRQKKILKTIGLKDRKIKPIQFSSVKTMGIFFTITDEESVKALLDFQKEMKNESISVKILGFCNLKELPNHLNPLIEFPFFTKKALNLWGVPNEPALENFTKDKYDIFIDLSLNPNFVSRYVAAKMNSGFRVGLHSEENEPFYDFLINEKEEVNQKTFIEHIVKYLRIINP